MFGVIRDLFNTPSVRTLLKYIMIPFLFQLVCTFLMVGYQVVFGTQQRILDLTWELNEETLYWPGIQSFEFTKKNSSFDRGYWYASNEFKASEHGGTHLDAPYHFNKDGWKVSEIPINRFFTNAIQVDFSAEVEAAGPDYVVEADLLESKIKKFEPIQNNTVVMIKYGWSKYWPDRAQYMRLDGNKVAHFPGLDNRSVMVIAKDERFVGVAVDTCSVDVGITKDYSAHRALLGRNVYVLENTKMTEHLPAKPFTLVVAPIKLTEGTGAPVRIFAVLT